jgi:hypothetical protein
VVGDEAESIVDARLQHRWTLHGHRATCAEEWHLPNCGALADTRSMKDDGIIEEICAGSKTRARVSSLVPPGGDDGSLSSLS